MIFIPETNNQYKFNKKGEVFSLKRNRLLKCTKGYYSIIYSYGRRNTRREGLINLFKFLEINTEQIPNYSNYEITTDGKIYSKTTNCWIKPFSDKDGYNRIALVNDVGNRVKERVARLVALTYIDNPNQYPIVNHIDEIKDNDFVENLEWCTHSQNTIHSKPWVNRDRDKNGRFI